MSEYRIKRNYHAPSELWAEKQLGDDTLYVTLFWSEDSIMLSAYLIENNGKPNKKSYTLFGRTVRFYGKGINRSADKLVKAFKYYVDGDANTVSICESCRHKLF